MSYTANFGVPTTSIAKEPPGLAAIVMPVSGTTTVANATPGRDSSSDSFQFAVYGLYQSSRPICTTTGAVLQAAPAGTLTPQAPNAGSYCLMWFGDLQSADASNLQPDQSRSFDLKAVQSGSDASHGYAGNTTVLHVNQSDAQSVLADLQQGPNLWAFGVAGLPGNPTACTISTGTFATTTFTIVQAEVVPSRQPTTLTCTN